MTRHISPLKHDGFTIDGTGYFACHQESHRVLYAKTPWCRVVVAVVLFALGGTAGAYGLVWNAPALFVVGLLTMAGLAWIYAPRKKGKKIAKEAPIEEEAAT